MTTIYVGNLSYAATEQSVLDLFSPHGKVEAVVVVTDQYSGRSKGFGFVTMPNDDQARAAIFALNGVEDDGRELMVNEARPSDHELVVDFEIPEGMSREEVIERLREFSRSADEFYRSVGGSGLAANKLSLLGSLAHRYHLCHEFEGCLMEHMALVGRRRNAESAHSSITSLNIRTASESRSQLMEDSVALGTEFVHMLGHLRDLETRMESELRREFPPDAVLILKPSTC